MVYSMTYSDVCFLPCVHIRVMFVTWPKSIINCWSKSLFAAVHVLGPSCKVFLHFMGFWSTWVCFLVLFLFGGIIQCVGVNKDHTKRLVLNYYDMTQSIVTSLALIIKCYFLINIDTQSDKLVEITVMPYPLWNWIAVNKIVDSGIPQTCQVSVEYSTDD